MTKSEIKKLKEEISAELHLEMSETFIKQIKNYLSVTCQFVYENPDYVDADEAAKRLNVSKPTAYKIIQKLNEQLEEKGYITVRGKVARNYFDEKCLFKLIKMSLPTDQGEATKWLWKEVKQIVNQGKEFCKMIKFDIDLIGEKKGVIKWTATQKNQI